MFQIPQYVLEKLRCAICASYLNSKPLMVRGEDQICGKCYKLLPAEEKEKCVRQIGLESIAEIIQFPCRYNTQGCTHTFNWCDEKEHESTCLYRSLISFSSDTSNLSNSDSIYRSLLNNEREFTCESEQIKASLSYDIKESTYMNESKNLYYSLKIAGHCDKSIIITDNNTSEKTTDVEINIQGNLFLSAKPELIYSDIKVKPIEHTNIYESIRRYDVRDDDCTKCGNNSHSNSNICAQCIKVLEKELKTVCKNYRKGCRETLHIEHVNNHETNCEFNDFKCLLEPCNVVTTLPNLKQHLKTDHSTEIFLTNEVNKKFGNKDETIVIFCHGSIFKCVFYYYKTFVDFIVTFVGSSDEAVKFYYEITAQSNGKFETKRSRCSNWNDTMLEKGVSFEKQELLGEQEKKLNIQVKLRIISKN